MKHTNPARVVALIAVTAALALTAITVATVAEPPRTAAASGIWSVPQNRSVAGQSATTSTVVTDPFGTRLRLGAAISPPPDEE